MKNKMTVLLVIMFTIASGAFAQTQPKAARLTDDQKELMQEVREKYSPKIDKIQQELRVVSAEQKAALSAKSINEKTVYANIDKMSALKKDLQKEGLMMHKEMVGICPFADKKQGFGPQQKQAFRGNGQGVQKRDDKNGQGMHQGRTSGQGQAMTQGAGNRKMTQGKGQASCPQGQMHQRNGQRGNGLNNGQGQKTQKFSGENCVMSDEQKTQIAAIKKTHFWGIQETENELAILKAKNVSVDDKLASLDKVSALQTKLANQKMAERLEVMQTLTEEQRMKMVAHQGMRKYSNGTHRGVVPRNK